jgi:5-methylcytosine-specific restriction endonuclease McrA
MADDAKAVRASRAVRKAIADFTAWAMKAKPPCWLCGQAIDYTIDDPYDDGHFEPDHLYPVSTHPEHAADPANLKASHRGCNRKRSNNMKPAGLGNQSRDWENI